MHMLGLNICVCSTSSNTAPLIVHMPTDMMPGPWSQSWLAARVHKVHRAQLTAGGPGQFQTTARMTTQIGCQLQAAAK